MLKQEVVDAVREGKFTIYSIESMEEGLEILTGMTAGRDEGGRHLSGKHRELPRDEETHRDIPGTGSQEGEGRRSVGGGAEACEGEPRASNRRMTASPSIP